MILQWINFFSNFTLLFFYVSQPRENFFEGDLRPKEQLLLKFLFHHKTRAPSHKLDPATFG